jgi:hypothetical protein
MSPLEAPDRVTLHIGRLARACLLVRPVNLEGHAAEKAVTDEAPPPTQAAAPDEAAVADAPAVAEAAAIAADGSQEKPASKRSRLRRRRRAASPVSTDVEQNQTSR